MATIIIKLLLGSKTGRLFTSGLVAMIPFLILSTVSWSQMVALVEKKANKDEIYRTAMGIQLPTYMLLVYLMFKQLQRGEGLLDIFGFLM